MTERSQPWTGRIADGAVGDAGPYTIDQWAEMYRSLFSRNLPNSGVIPNRGSNYDASGATSPVVIAAGQAMVNGTWHISDANVNVTVPTPAGATRIDRIVLRKTWLSQEVRITRIEGVEGGGAPAITQLAGDTWDVPLWQASITTGGAITLTDERVYAISEIAGLPVQKIAPTDRDLLYWDAATTRWMVGKKDYSCAAYNTGNISVTNAAWALVTFDSEEWDDTNIHNTGSNTHRFTAPIDGLYLVTFAQQPEYGMMFQLVVNGGETLFWYVPSDAAGNNRGGSPSVFLINLSAGQYFHMEARRPGGASTQNLNGGRDRLWLRMMRVGRKTV